MTKVIVPEEKDLEKVRLDAAIMPDGSIYQLQDNQEEDKWELRLDRIPNLIP